MRGPGFRFKSMIQAFGQYIERRLEQLRVETRKRASVGEQRKFSGRPFRIAGFVGVLVTLYFSQTLIDPGKKPYTLEALTAPGTSFELITKGKIQVAHGLPPNLVADDVRDVTFDKSIETWPSVRVMLPNKPAGDEFWYTFDVDLRNTPLAQEVPSRTIDVLIPGMFGNLSIYEDGKLISSYINSQHRIVADTDHFRIDVRVRPNLKEFWIPGLTAHYPVVIGKNSSLDKIETYLQLETNRYIIALAMQVIALIAVFALVMAGSALAEVVPFCAFLTVNVFYAYYEYLKFNFAFPIEVSTWANRIVLLTFVALQGFLILWFSCEFFRISKERVLKLLLRSVFGWIVWMVAFDLALFTSSKFHAMNTLFAENFIFFGLITPLAIGLDFIFVLKKTEDPIRKVIATLFLGSVCYFYFSASYNYFGAAKHTTSEVMVQFLNYVLTLVTLATELGRSTVERDEQRKKLPKERPGEPKNEFSKSDHPSYLAFIVMCDAVGYTAKFWKLRSMGLEIISHYQNRVRNYLLSRFATPETSVHSGTGDGFYFGVRWEWTQDSVRKILEMCRNVVGNEILLRDIGVPWLGDEILHFRCIIVFGPYTITSSSVSGIGSQDHGGEYGILLQRGSGSGGDPIAIRFLVNEYTRDFKKLPFGRILSSSRKSLEEGSVEVIEYSIKEIDEILSGDWLSRIFEEPLRPLKGGAA